jgi:hypothetical protein
MTFSLFFCSTINDSNENKITFIFAAARFRSTYIAWPIKKTVSGTTDNGKLRSSSCCRRMSRLSCLIQHTTSLCVPHCASRFALCVSDSVKDNTITQYHHQYHHSLSSLRKQKDSLHTHSNPAATLFSATTVVQCPAILYTRYFVCCFIYIYIKKRPTRASAS